MKRTSAKITCRTLPILVILFFVCASFNVSAQPEQKRVLANQAFSEGERLADENTVDSIQKALVKFQISSKLYLEAGDKNGEGKARHETGLMFQKLGKYGEALENYKKSYELFSETENLSEKAKSINKLGTIYSILGNKKLAFDLYNVALRIFYQIDAFYEAVPTINNIGVYYQDSGDSKNALFYFNLALPHVRLNGDIGSEGMILLNIGDVYSDSGDFVKAIDYFKQSISLHKAAKNEAGEVRTLYQLGVASFRANKKADSVDYFNQSLVLNGSRFKNEEALTLQYLMHSWKDLGNRKLAIYYGKLGVNSYQELRSGIQILDVQTQRIFLKSIENTYRELADLLISQGQFANAEQVLQMLKEEEYFDFVRRDAEEIKTLDQRISLNEPEQKLIARYAIFADRIAEIGREYEELENKKQKSKLSAAEQKKSEDLSAQIADADAAFKLFLEKELVAEFGKTTKSEIDFDRELQANLRKWGEGTVTLYTVVSENRYRVILTTPTTQIDGKTEISAADLNKKIFEFREALQDIEIDPRPLGKELYDILIKPIEKDLKAANAKTLVWSLDGTLRYIPISTLSPDGKTYLVENYRNVITTPQTKTEFSGSDTEWRALGVGVSESQTIANPENPDKKIKFSPIPGTKTELMTIIRDELKPDENGILSGRRFIDKDFTIDSLTEALTTKTATGKRKFTAVHIASHFKLGSNWSNSFLLLGIGQILTLKELKTSSELEFSDVELVTLSACDTAFTIDSNGKEIDSLAEVIQAKSGKAVLAALWAVVDESTPLFMGEFYRLRKENPQISKAEAIQKVQNAFISGELKPSAEYVEKLSGLFNDNQQTPNRSAFKFDKKAPFAHPYFWSPFVLIGNWR